MEWTSTSAASTRFTVHKLTFTKGEECSILLDKRMLPLLPRPSSPSTPLPSQSHRTPHPPCFEIKDAGPGKGLGMFAMRAIPAGALILVEHPAIVTPGHAPQSLAPADRTAAYRALSTVLSEGPKAGILGMSNCRPVRGEGGEEGGEEGEGECLTPEEGIAWTNGTTIGLTFPDGMRGKEEREYGAVFVIINRSNHSCGPNAAHKWDLPTFSASLYALRPIAPGEEITMTYTPPTLPSTLRIAHLQSHYGFTCLCPHCTLPPPQQSESDASRARLRDWHLHHPGYAKWWRDLARADDAVINACLEALELVEREGVQGMMPLFVEELCKCYAVLGEEGEWRRWAGVLVGLCEVADPGVVREVVGEGMEGMRDVRRVRRWGWRRVQRMQMNGRKRRVDGDPPDVEAYFSPALF